MRGKDYGVSLAQEVEGARPRYGYLRRGASSVGRWSCREFESEFYVQTYQEHGAWRLALRVGRRAEKIEAERNSTRALRCRIDLRIGRIRVKNLVELPVQVEETAQVVPIPLLERISHFQCEGLDAMQNLNALGFTGQISPNYLLHQIACNPADPRVIKHKEILKLRSEEH